MDVQVVVMKEWMNKASYGGCSKADGVQDLHIPPLSTLSAPQAAHLFTQHRESPHTDKMLPALCTLFTALSCVSGVTVVTQKPPVLTATKGEKITMHCNVGIVTSYVTYWYKQVPGGAPQYMLYDHHSYSSPSYGSGFSSPKFTSTHPSQKDYTLIISNVEAGDSAVYYCNTWDGSARVSSQKVLTQTPSVQTDRSKTVTMDCNIAKDEGQYVCWYKQIPQSAPQFVLSFYHSHSSPNQYGDGFSSSRFTSKASSSIDYQLIISNVEAGDSAVYYCGVSSQKVLTQTPSVQTDRSKTVTMDCNIAKDENQYVYWYKQIPQAAPQFVLKLYHSESSPNLYGDGFSSSRFTSKASSSIGYQLIISNVEAGDSAVYYCKTYDGSTSAWVSQ
ncbi:hypothetical protein NFI96_029165 [Prochilodus magdalenae]|nr:hypothetical protein NFI96_029165 [Prochilodus magdalenae]